MLCSHVAQHSVAEVVLILKACMEDVFVDHLHSIPHKQTIQGAFVFLSLSLRSSANAAWHIAIWKSAQAICQAAPPGSQGSRNVHMYIAFILHYMVCNCLCMSLYVKFLSPCYITISLFLSPFSQANVASVPCCYGV